MSRPVRTRYAPSPTGFQHIGGIRTALYCYLFTRKNNGSFVLRIEDTDLARFVPGAEQYIIDALNWCGITCDEGVHVGGAYGPYRQSDRKEIYRRYVQQLLDTGHAYYAFDTQEDLEAMRESLKLKDLPTAQYNYNPITRMHMRNSLTLPPREVEVLLQSGQPYVVRFKIPDNETVMVNDLIRGEVSVHTHEMDDKVLLKSDGMPTYHLANVVDDHLMEITHVIRGEEWLPSTPLHVLLYRAFGWTGTMPSFAHVPLMLKPDGNGKLSKRDADRLGFTVFPLAYIHPLQKEQATGFREMGFLPEAFVNMLALFGWHPEGEQEIFSMQELIEAFSVDRIGKSGAKFDFDKAKWFNQQYIKNTPDERLSELIRPFAPDDLKNIPAPYLSGVCALMKERVTFLPDFWTNGHFFFSPPASYDEKTVQKKWNAKTAAYFTQLCNRLCHLPQFTAADIEREVKTAMQEHQLGMGDVLPLLRIMLAGTISGPPVFDMAALLGADEVNNRLSKGLTAFDSIVKPA
ncbi:glutamate--tRNA ligase [Sphingobacteriales bacterium UPWRP_1]|nr:glutamate--tRNA ligase [Sphingobacteriales bacterium TSM_CSM]PSJ78879.1 glutamate--tRNA ligase [Sphingobacteriales bacterium UPWRP_1]